MIRSKTDRNTDFCQKKVQKETKKLLESNENIDKEVISYSLEAASEYWRKHIEDKGQVIQDQRGFGLDVEDNFDTSYLKELTRDIYDEWNDKLEIEDISVLADTLTTLPEESRFDDLPWNYDPKYTPETDDHPSMFQ